MIFLIVWCYIKEVNLNFHYPVTVILSTFQDESILPWFFTETGAPTTCDVRTYTH